MSKTPLERKYSNFIVTLLLLFPILINSVKILGNLILLIFTILGIYIAISEKKNPFNLSELKLFSWLTTGYFLVMLLSILVADGWNAEFHHLGRKLHFLLAPWIALAIFQIDMPLKNLLLSIKLGLIIIGVITIIEALLLGNYQWVSGMINSNVFGDIAVAMLFLSIVQIPCEITKERIITFIAITAGISAIVLSSSRGSWLSFLILSVVYISLIYKSSLKNNNKGKIFLVLFFSALIGFISTQTNVVERIKTATTGVEIWSSTGDTQSSAAQRLDMWASGLKAARNSPWFGYGYRNANTAVQEYTSQDISYTHLHNEYITNLVSAGIFGLLALLTLLFTPMVIFYQNLKGRDSCLSMMGTLLCVGYVTFGFTHIALGEEHMNAFYVLFMGFLLPKVIKISKVNKLS
jgi:O-antigen ligase